MGELMIRSWGGEGVSWIIKNFSSNLNTVNFHFKIKPWPFYDEIMKGLIIKRFQKLYHAHLPLFCFWPVVLIYYLKSWGKKQEDEFEKHLLHYASLEGDFMQSVSFF